MVCVVSRHRLRQVSNGFRVAWLSGPIQGSVRGALEETAVQAILNEVDNLTMKNEKGGGGLSSRQDGVRRVDAKSYSCGASSIHDLDAGIPAKN